MIPRLLLCCLALAGQAWAQSDPEPSENDWKIHLEFQCVALPEKTALELLPDLNDETKLPDAWKKLEGLTKAGQAKIVALQHRSTTHGESVNAVQGATVRYADEFSAPIAGSKLLEVQAARGKKNALPETDSNAFAGKLSQGIIIPAERLTEATIGTKLSAVPRVSSDGTRLLVELEFERSWLLPWDEVEMAQLVNGETITIKQPRIGKASDKSMVALTSGERIFLSWHKVPNDQVELTFFRGWTIQRKSSRP